MSAMRAISLSARDGIMLAVDDWPGDGARLPVVCLGGLLRNGADFAGPARRIAPGRRVLAPHWRGRGRSDRTRDWRSYAPASLAADLLDLLAALHVPRAVFIGTSMGGLIGLGLASIRPGLVGGLVLNDIGPEVAGPGLAFVRDATRNTPAQRDLAEAADYLRGRLPHLSFRTQAEWEEFAAATFRRAYGSWLPDWDPAIARTLDAPVPDLWPLWRGAAHVPLLLVHGGRSDILRADTVARMRADRPDLAVVTLPEVGHAPSLAEPEAAAAIDEFLTRLP